MLSVGVFLVVKNYWWLSASPVQSWSVSGESDFILPDYIFCRDFGLGVWLLNFFFPATLVVWAIVILVLLDFFFLQLSFSGLVVEFFFFFATVMVWAVTILVLLDFFLHLSHSGLGCCNSVVVGKCCLIILSQ